MVGCLITYKGPDGNEHKYNVDKYYDSQPLSVVSEICNKDILIKTQLFSEFINEFNNANDEDKKNCYKILDDKEGNCQNLALIRYILPLRSFFLVLTC